MAEAGVIPIFSTHTVPNLEKTKKEGRPIYDEIEIVELRYPANKECSPVFPAHDRSDWVIDPETGNQVERTYAQRWPAQYQRFKDKKVQIAEGTPLDEVPFLTAKQRSELKALNVLTAELLAGLDGPQLKRLGPGGREMKDKAQAYIDNAAGSANATRLAAENADLKDMVQKLLAEKQQNTNAIAAATEAQEAREPVVDDSLAVLSDAELKERVKELTGSAPRGQPARETLVRMVREAEGEAA